MVLVLNTSVLFAAIKDEWDQTEQDYYRAREKVKTTEERKLVDAKAPDLSRFADRFLKLAEAHGGTKEELAALCWASLNGPSSDAGKKVTFILTGGRIDRADLRELIEAFEKSETLRRPDVRPLVPATLARVKRFLDHPQAARLLACVCFAFVGDNNEKAPEPFVEAANLIADRFADSPDISHFCESLFLQGCQPWAGDVEKQLKAVVAKNHTPLVRATSRYALASVLRRGVETQTNGVWQFSMADFYGLHTPHPRPLSPRRRGARGG